MLGVYESREQASGRPRYRVYYRTSHMEAHHPGDEVWCMDGDSIAVDASDQVTILRVEPVPLPVLLDTIPTGDWLASDHVFTVPESGWYRFNGGKPVELTDDEVRAMGFKP